MMNTSGFYKADSGTLVYAPNTVYGPGYTLLRSAYTEYTYPVGGWSWFNNEGDARYAFNLPANPEAPRSGVITSGDFVLRFAPAEYGSISAASINDPIIAGLLARVRESAEVVLYAPEVVQGVGYLVAQGLLTEERGAEILSYAVVVNPAEPVPEPEPQPEPEPEPEPEPTPEP